MLPREYTPADARALLPLLDSIRRELEERGARLSEIEERMEDLEEHPESAAELRELVTEAATLRLALRNCHHELERLGCSVLGSYPITFRIPLREGATRRSLVWRRESAPDP